MTDNVVVMQFIIIYNGFHSMGAFGVSYHTIISLFLGNKRSVKESHGNVCTLFKITPFTYLNETNFPNKITFNVYPIEYSLQRDKHSTSTIIIV